MSLEAKELPITGLTDANIKMCPDPEDVRIQILKNWTIEIPITAFAILMQGSIIVFPIQS